MTSIFLKKNKLENIIYQNISKLFKALLMLVLTALRCTLKATTKGILKPSNKKLIFLNLVALIVTLILAYFKPICLNFIFIFTLRGFYLNAKDYLKNYKFRAEIAKNNKKYKRLIQEVFANKITITKVDQNKITVFSNELTLDDILKQKSKFELYFNRKISNIARNQRNFKYNYLYFERQTSFKKYYRLDQYINTIDKKELDSMEIPAIVGIDEKGDMIIFDFVMVKNLFIAGEPGGGKSVLMNILIQSLMVFNDNCIYIMIDLKEGVELSDYDHFKNCITVSTSEELKNVINTVNKIMIDRLKKIRAMDNCKNIQDYNAKKNVKKMDYIFLFIDEMAEIKLNTSGQKRSDEETELLQIGQKARAAGIFIVGATQRPSGEQINTDIRAIFQKAISLCISTKETQRMTKIPGTENLKPGEFKTNIWNDTSKIYKSFLVSSEENKKAGLPKCNTIYEDLKHILQYEKFFIEIKPKLENKKTNVNSLCNRMLTKLNKGYTKKLVQTIDYHNFINLVPKSIKKQVADIKKLSQIYDLSLEDAHLHHGDNYIKLLNFLLENQQNNGLLPTSSNIINALQLTKRTKDDLLQQALTEGYIKKRSKTRFEINKNCQDWAKIKN